METEYPLQDDIVFEKLRFRHDEKLSREIFDIMDKGKKIYPHEGLLRFKDIIDKIETATMFSKEAFDYAFDKSNYFKDKEDCRNIILTTNLYDKSIIIEKNTHPFHVLRQRRRSLDREYAKFYLEKDYGIKLMTRYIDYDE